MIIEQSKRSLFPLVPKMPLSWASGRVTDLGMSPREPHGAYLEPD